MPNFQDSLAEFFGQSSADVIGDRQTRADGTIKRTFGDTFWGRSDTELEQAQQGARTKKYRDTYDAQLGTYGLEGVKDNENLASITARLKAGKSKDTITTATETATAMHNLPGAVRQRTIEDRRYQDGVTRSDRQFQASQDNVANQMELARADRQTAEKNRLADRIDAREARADELMFRRESMERADRKDEKNRRRESIQALVAGLSSLGAAFAV